ncbi:TonB-dependent receptor [Sesbania bispinosa]|nr:TonB-dependent receptor [Sesbania bispinosa]
MEARTMSFFLKVQVRVLSVNLLSHAHRQIPVCPFDSLVVPDENGSTTASSAVISTFGTSLYSAAFETAKKLKQYSGGSSTLCGMDCGGGLDAEHGGCHEGRRRTLESLGGGS